MAGKWHFNVHDKADGILRQLGAGASVCIFGGERMTASVVELEPGASSPVHSHPQEQWGIMVEGEVTRILGNSEAIMKPGDFWHTPGNVSHGMVAGPQGAVVITIFSAPGDEYVTTEGGGYSPI